MKNPRFMTLPAGEDLFELVSSPFRLLGSTVLQHWIWEKGSGLWIEQTFLYPRQILSAPSPYLCTGPRLAMRIERSLTTRCEDPPTKTTPAAIVGSRSIVGPDRPRPSRTNPCIEERRKDAR